MIRWIREVVKAQTSAGVRRAIRDLWHEVQLQRHHRSSLKRAKEFSSRANLKLNIGCGSNLKADWVNIDLFQKADLQLDIRENLPFADESVSIVYSEHFFEHLEYPDEALKFLRESWRVLTPGGIFSLGIPDFVLSITSPFAVQKVQKLNFLGGPEF